MNVALILLVIVILILATYIIYYVGFAAQALLDLSVQNVGIPNKDLINPKSTSFTYGAWVYVNNWSSNTKTIVLANSGTTTNLKLYLADTSPILNVDILTTKTTNATQTIQITDNFPIQRWVLIIVSVEGTVVDCYLDGKLVKSVQLSALPKLDNTYSISYGVFDAFMTKFYRIAKATDPQTAWNQYMAGNGFGPKYGPDIGFDFTLTKDKRPIVQYKYQ